MERTTFHQEPNHDRPRRPSHSPPAHDAHIEALVGQIADYRAALTTPLDPDFKDEDSHALLLRVVVERSAYLEPEQARAFGSALVVREIISPEERDAVDRTVIARLDYLNMLKGNLLANGMSEEAYWEARKGPGPTAKHAASMGGRHVPPPENFVGRTLRKRSAPEPTDPPLQAGEKLPDLGPNLMTTLFQEVIESQQGPQKDEIDGWDLFLDLAGRNRSLVGTPGFVPAVIGQLLHIRGLPQRTRDVVEALAESCTGHEVNMA